MIMSLAFKSLQLKILDLEKIILYSKNKHLYNLEERKIILKNLSKPYLKKPIEAEYFKIAKGIDYFKFMLN